MKNWKRLLVWMILLLPLLGVAAYFALLEWQKEKLLGRLTDDQRAQYERVVSEPLDISMEDLDAKPFDENTIKARDEFLEEWEKTQSQVETLSSLAGENPARLWENKERLMAEEATIKELTPLFLSYEKLVDREDYALDVMRSGLPPRFANVSSGQVNITDRMLSIRAMNHLLGLRALLEMQRGRKREALVIINTMIDSSRINPYETMLLRSLSKVMMSRTANVVQVMVNETTSREALQELVSELESYQDNNGLFTQSGSDIQLKDHLGMIRALSRRGFEAEIDGLTGREVVNKSYQLQGDYLENNILPKMAEGEKKQQLREQQEAYQEQGLSDYHFTFVWTVSLSSAERLHSLAEELETNLQDLQLRAVEKIAGDDGQVKTNVDIEGELDETK